MSVAAVDPLVVVVLGDCEAVRSWLGAQPVNTASSLAYLVAAGVLLRWWRRGPGSGWLVLAAGLVAESAGSAAFHAGDGTVGAALHDAALVAIVAYLGGWHAGRALRVGRDIAPAVSLIAAVAFLPLAVGVPGATSVVVGLALVVLVAGEVWARRCGLAPVLELRLVAVASIAVLAWWTGRTGGALCRPGSLLQPHALWHVLSAATVVLWARRAMAAQPTLGTSTATVGRGR